jgi:hypothetical protein
MKNENPPVRRPRLVIFGAKAHAVEPLLGQADTVAWTLVCRLDDIPRLGTRRVTRARGPDVTLFRHAGGVVDALLDGAPEEARGDGVATRFAVKVEAGWVWLDGEELRSHAGDRESARMAAVAEPG